MSLFPESIGNCFVKVRRSDTKQVLKTDQWSNVPNNYNFASLTLSNVPCNRHRKTYIYKRMTERLH